MTITRPDFNSVGLKVVIPVEQCCDPAVKPSSCVRRPLLSLLLQSSFAGKKAKDLRNWLTIYSYWNQGGLDNVATMLLYLVEHYSQPTGVPPQPLVETPDTGDQKTLLQSDTLASLLLNLLT